MNEVKELLILILESIDKFRNSILGSMFLGILPALGTFFKFIYLKWSKFIILPFRDEKDSKDDTLGMLVELYKSFLPLVVWFGTIAILMFVLFLLKVAYSGNESYIFIFLVVLLLVSREISKLKNNKISKVQIFELLFLVDLYIGVMLIYFAGENEKAINVIISLCSLFSYLAIEYSLKDSAFLKKYVYYTIKLLRIIRITMASMFIILYGMNLKADKLILSEITINIYFTVWVVLCIGEWIILEIKDTSKFVEFQVSLEDENIFTKKGIEQLNSNKVKVILNNGNERIVDNREIKYIQYSLKNFSAKKGTGKVFCFLYDGSIIQYHNKKIIDDNWIRFYTIHRDRCDIILMNSKLVKKIHFEI